MSQKRVLFVIDLLDRFSATRQLDLLTQQLGRDHDVHVAVLGSHTPLPTSVMADANQGAADGSRQFHFLGASSFETHSFRTLFRSGLRLRKLIRQLKPDLIHAWCQPAERVTLAACAEFDSIRKFATELYVRPSTNMTMEAVDRRLGKPVEQYIVPHEKIRESLVGHQYVEEKISIVPGAVGQSDIDRVAARRKLIQLVGAGKDVRLAGAVAPLVPRSRLKDLVWATDLLTCIRGDFHFIIFGRGTQRQRLERFAFQTEAGHHVHFVDSELHAMDLIPGLDFFWQSHLNEPHPGALHHAMQSAVPVVSVYGPGTSESIEHQATAFATNFGARDEFARWTKYLLEKTDSGARLAEQGRDSLSGKFLAGEMADGYRKLYEV